MSREKQGYRENLQDILEFTSGRHILNISQVKRFTGLADNRTVKRRFPIRDGFISAAMLALYLSGGDKNQ